SAASTSPTPSTRSSPASAPSRTPCNWSGASWPWGGFDMGRRVVITGVGPVTPVGTGRDSFALALRQGRCGIGPVESFDTSRYKVHHGAEVKGFCPEAFVRRQSPAHLGRAS